MRRLSLGLSGIVFGVFIFGVALLGGARRAGADIPPPDACTAPGQPCNNAGPSHDQAGICTESTCSRTVPGPDGGMMPMMYACNLCKQGGQGGDGDGGNGAGGNTGTGGRNGDAGSDDAGAPRPSKGGSGCSAGGSVVSAGGCGALALVVVAMVGLTHSRRRRRP